MCVCVGTYHCPPPPPPRKLYITDVGNGGARGACAPHLFDIYIANCIGGGRFGRCLPSPRSATAISTPYEKIIVSCVHNPRASLDGKLK